MFERFADRFAVTEGSAGHAWEEPRLLAADGYAEFAARWAGCTFERGLYRVHDARSGPKGLQAIEECFPAYRSRAVPFGFDWLGRQLALDPERHEGEESLVLLFEPDTGDVFQVPATFRGFHDEELITNTDAALLDVMFGEWARHNETALPLRHDQCVGYRIPLVLGGRDEVDNLEVIDLEVYWALSGQIGTQVADLTPGTAIRDVSIEE